VVLYLAHSRAGTCELGHIRHLIPQDNVTLERVQARMWLRWRLERANRERHSLHATP